MATLGGNLAQRPRCWYYRNKLTHCLRKGGERCYAFRGESKYHCILGGGPCYIVHPSDPAVALLALDASTVITGPAGTRTVSLSDLFLLPRQDVHREVDLAVDELIVEVVVPVPEEGARSAQSTRSVYLKVAERAAWDFALVSAAVQVSLEGDTVRRARVVLGGVAPVPWRAEGAEEVLVGGALDDASIARAAQAATEGARPLAQNAYKVDMAQGIVRQALHGLRP
jgi:xanthine dehydrogenase YagS FAD-binding subunit